ncbi:MAG: response regulator, partial [Burkholderiales bacterium]
MTTADRRPLRMLLVEDAKSDYELILTLLAGAGFAVTAQKVEDEPALRAALAEHEWDLLISDHSPPRFSAHAALSTLQSTGLDIPFLIVSGSIGEDGALQAMLA